MAELDGFASLSPLYELRVRLEDAEDLLFVRNLLTLKYSTVCLLSDLQPQGEKMPKHSNKVLDRFGQEPVPILVEFLLYTSADAIRPL